MQGKKQVFQCSHLSEAKFRAIIRYFAHDLPAWKIAELSGVSRPTINQLFMKLRIGIAQVCNASSHLSGEVEVDESYFGAHRVCGKRGAEQAVNQLCSESWNATGKCRKSSMTLPKSTYRARSGVRYPINLYQERPSMRGAEANDLPPLEETLQPVECKKIPVLEVDEL